MEPLAEEVNALIQQEEKDGQPAGRLQYQLRPGKGSFLTSHLSAISRVYGEHGNEVLQHLSRNPLAAIPIILRRLKQKDQEWREVRRGLRPRWKDITTLNQSGSLDVKCYFYKREVEKTFGQDLLFEELKKARVYLRKPRLLSPAVASIAPTISAIHSCPTACLVQPHLKISIPSGECHRDAYLLLSEHITKIARNNTDRERASRIWVEFIVPFFGNPFRWYQKELRDISSGGVRADRSSCIVRYAPGQSVRTLYGDGEILQLREGRGEIGMRYAIRFAFGIGMVRPSAIVHAILGTNNTGTRYVRHGGYMDILEGLPTVPPEGVPILKEGCHMFSGTNKIYVFFRLYCLLIKILAELREASKKKPMEKVSKPGLGSLAPATVKPNNYFNSIMKILTGVVRNKVTDYETKCRAVMGDRTYLCAALPKLVEKCSDAFLKVAKEDLCLPLFDFSQLRHMDPVLIRTQCLSITNDAQCRIQYHPDESSIYFSYLSAHDELLTSIPDDMYETEDKKRSSGGDERENYTSKRQKIKV
mmetsp:Transcript_14759/g.32622  ORF Transcript_14759/g.32622 Transcript_14759/m.32622 type:complete len:532 (-) Transcript_14759:120-1715(-)